MTRVEDVIRSQESIESRSDFSHRAATGRTGLRARIAAGFAALWSVLPGWRPAARIARLPGIRGLLELAYRGFLPARPFLARMVGRFSKG